jgi:hypothetical protein
MAARRTPDALALAQDLRAALGVLAGARRALAEDDPPELGHLVGTLERLHRALGSLAAADRERLRPELLMVLDEASSLADGLTAEHARVAAALRRVGTKRRADRAYRQASRL